MTSRRRRTPPGATTRGGWGSSHQKRRAAIAPLVNAGKSNLRPLQRAHPPQEDGTSTTTKPATATSELRMPPAISEPPPQSQTAADHYRISRNGRTGGRNAGLTTRSSAPSPGATSTLATANGSRWGTRRLSS